MLAISFQLSSIWKSPGSSLRRFVRASKPIMKSFLVVHIESWVGVVEVIVGKLIVRESGVDLTLIFYSA
jgi:hypothetical protein